MNSKPANSKHDEDFHQVHLTSTRMITWKIRRFKSLPGTTGYKLDSPPFVFQSATWCLRLYPKAYCREENKTYVGYTLVRRSSHVPHHKLNVILKGERLGDEKSFVVNFDEEHKERGSKKFVQRFEVLYWTPFDVTLMCQISSYESLAVEGFSQTEPLIQGTKAVGVLCQNYKNLLQNGQDHDVILKVKDKEFRAHQNILRARSPVMASMLGHDMMEKSNGVIDIPDCDPNAFEQFLLYLYCAKLETMNTDNMLSLYYVADKYDVGDLKEDCRELIIKSLSSSNITDVIEVALNHSDAGLLQSATDYFVKGVREILPTVEWQSFLKRNSIWANELMLKAVKSKSGGKRTLAAF